MIFHNITVSLYFYQMDAALVKLLWRHEQKNLTFKWSCIKQTQIFFIKYKKICYFSVFTSDQAFLCALPLVL